MLVLVSGILGAILCERFRLTEIFWTHGVILEAVAIIPQRNLTEKKKYAEKTLVFYIGMLMFYKMMYVVHWIYLYNTRYYFEGKIAMIAGIIQLYFYLDCLLGTIVPIFKPVPIKSADLQEWFLSQKRRVFNK